MPACFDRRTGKLLYYHLAEYNKTGGAFVAADEARFFNHYRDRDTDLYDVLNGKVVARKVGRYPVLSRYAYYMSGDSITVRDARQPKAAQFALKLDATGDLIRSGSRLYAGGEGQIAAVDIVWNGKLRKRSLKTAWVQKVEGKVGRLVAANGMLFAVTLDGKLIAFGKEDVSGPDPPGEGRGPGNHAGRSANRPAPSSTTRGRRTGTPCSTVSGTGICSPPWPQRRTCTSWRWSQEQRRWPICAAASTPLACWESVSTCSKELPTRSRRPPTSPR